MDLTTIVEALLIASEEPLSSEAIARFIRLASADEESVSISELPDGLNLAQYESVCENDILKAITDLNEYYESNSRSISILERSQGWKIFTRPDFSIFVKQLFPGAKPQRLSGPAMETLAIIAYRQPITKAAMEAVRGVSCDGMIQKLLDRELICIGGRADLPGRPLLYQTTATFFEHFGIKSVEDLPNSNELRSAVLPSPKEEPSHESVVKPTQPTLDSIMDNQDSPPEITPK